MDDARKVLSVSYDAASVADRQARIAVVAEALDALVPADIVGWAELGMAAGASTTMLTATGPERSAVTSLVAQHAEQHPIGRWLQRSPTSVQPVRLSDIVPSGWRRGRFFADVFRPIGVVNQLAIPLPPYRTGRVRAWALSRSGRDFSDASLTLTAHLQPLLAALAAFDRLPETVPAEDGVEDGVELTPRERQILGLIASGLTAQQIGWTLRLRVSTVNTHTEHLYAKLGVHDRVSAARRAADFAL